ncbi:pancreatic triacylglycerol lipase-like [Adelges cooleyi]|uniref:pancreatic triacylglycerol lipase-like n=1 Tax=Adelges cooleyi TaxID=133065 RepID=UPI00217FDB88|nr:pancreatic triacylglycerol lipase-like [Adelges cooleyi]
MNYTMLSIVLIVLTLLRSSKPNPLNTDSGAICESLPSDQNSIKFYLYTKKSSAELTVDKDSINAAPFADSNKLVLYLHGFAESVDVAGPKIVRDAYLNGTEDLNVVLVDYSGMSMARGFTLYDFASSFPRSRYCYLPRIADRLAEMISLIQEVVARISHTHLVGLSLGAQIAGKTGRRYKEITGRTLNRVTALDAAGTCFEQSPEISRDSAIFVDAIHTNAGWFGLVAPVGHVDVYLNNGIVQPICLTNADAVTGFLGMPSAMEEPTICSHVSSVLFFVASINNDKIYAQPCRQIRQLTRNAENIFLLDRDNDNAISLTCSSSSNEQQIVFGQHVPHNALGTYHATISNILELLNPPPSQ